MGQESGREGEGTQANKIQGHDGREEEREGPNALSANFSDQERGGGTEHNLCSEAFSCSNKVVSALRSLPSSGHE